METSKRSTIMVATLVVILVATVVLLIRNSRPPVTEATASNYYHGVFRNQKNPKMFGDENGNPAPRPADAGPDGPESAAAPLPPGTYKNGGAMGAKPP